MCQEPLLKKKNNKVGICYMVGMCPWAVIIIYVIFVVVITVIIIVVTCGPTSNVGGGEINCASILPLVQIFIIL